MTAPSTAKELGVAKTARELVPGDVGVVDANVSALADEYTTVSGAYDDFGRMRIPNWTGLAQLAWEGSYDAECEKWKAYQSLLSTAKQTLSTYASALTRAQTKAQTALDKWNEGEQKTETARSAYDRDVDAYNAAVRDYWSDPSPAKLNGLPDRPGAFHDPGQALREEAEEILAQAREDLDEAGRTALQELGALEGAKTEGDVDTFGADGSAEGPSFKWDWWERTFGDDPATGRDGRYDNGQDPGPFEISLGNVEGEAWIWRATGSVEDYWGPVKVHADGSVTALGADGSAEAVLNGEGLTINADGTLTVVGAEGEVGAEYGYAEGTLSGEAFLGANAEGGVTADKTGLHAGGEAFAGGKVSGTVEGDVGGVGGGFTAEGWAGAGAALDADLGFDDGKLTVGGSGGLAWGLGGKLGGEVTLDFPEMYDTGKDIVEGIGSLVP